MQVLSNSFVNLNYDEYPAIIKSKVNDSQDAEEKKVFKIWSNFSKSLEIKKLDTYSSEIIFKTKDDNDNSLSAMIKNIDKSYPFMSF